MGIFVAGGLSAAYFLANDQKLIDKICFHLNSIYGGQIKHEIQETCLLNRFNPIIGEKVYADEFSSQEEPNTVVKGNKQGEVGLDQLGSELLSDAHELITLLMKISESVKEFEQIESSPDYDLSESSDTVLTLWSDLLDLSAKYVSLLRRYQERYRLFDLKMETAIEELNPDFMKELDHLRPICKILENKGKSPELSFLKERGTTRTVDGVDFDIVLPTLGAKNFSMIVAPMRLQNAVKLAEPDNAASRQGPELSVQSDKIAKGCELELKHQREIEELRRHFEEELTEIKRSFTDIIKEKEKQEISSKIPELVGSFFQASNLTLIAALRNQEKEIASMYETELEGAKAEIRTQYSRNAESLLARVGALSRIMDSNNEMVDLVVQNSAMLKLAYSLQLSLTGSTVGDRTTPISPYIRHFKDCGVTIAEIVSQKFPLSAIESGVYTRRYLLKRLADLKPEAERLVYSQSKPVSYWTRFTSSLHSAFRLRGPNAITNSIHDKTEDIFEMYAILDSLERSIQAEDLVECYKKVNLLTGNSRMVLDDWIKDASDTILTISLSELLLVSLTNQVFESKSGVSND